ncbi:MAG TPA: hypothetical protein ENL20_09950 [Candidatus Cloacimonetes bacterium]|nr:hypothetical protein [Candidatus Cloacimonadota bacterium]
MKSVLNNKYVAALKNLMLFTAIIHMIIVTIYSAINLNLLKFNFLISWTSICFSLTSLQVL